MKLGHLFRTLSPLVLLAICALVWFERSIPGAPALTERLGQDFVMRFCLGVLSLYVLLLWGESLRLHAMLTAVLKAMQDFGRARRDEAAGGEGKRLEAVRLLVAALETQDAGVRRSSREHLARLVGQDLGDDPSAWRQWLEKQDAQRRGPPR